MLDGYLNDGYLLPDALVGRFRTLLARVWVDIALRAPVIRLAPVGARAHMGLDVRAVSLRGAAYAGRASVYRSR